MAEIKIICPRCGQHIQCDELWGGHQIQCPSCQAGFTVPQVAAPPPAPPPPPAPVSSDLGKQLVAVPKGNKLSAGATQVARSSTPTGAVHQSYKGPAVKKQNPLAKYGTVAAAVLALLVAGYFIAKNLGYLPGKSQEEASAPQPDAKKKASDNGDAAAGQQAASPDAAAGDATAGNAPPAVTNLPVIPAVWTLDLNSAKIPEGKANGKVSGTNFVVETARIDKVGTSYVMSLRQGSGRSPDRELLVYLRLAPTEGPTNRTISVSSDMKGANVGTVIKKWKTNPQFAPLSKTFANGYALKLELGQLAEDSSITGKIFLALPDEEQTVVAGLFKAAAGLTPAVIQQPDQQETQPAAGMDPAMRRRYNLPGR